ncbi:Uncharacterised protein [Weissella viridescens]|uniref:Uncharacterized protein n=1 Tax=Weissella viridescens TaxID=1629 RepID=A0A380NZ32_WEIVI|nr:Uncharacterised protein [Weissella viridescens]
MNKKHPLKQELGFKKVEMNGIPVSQTIQEPLERFMHDAQSAGYPATLVSGYRSKLIKNRFLIKTMSKMSVKVCRMIKH